MADNTIIVRIKQKIDTESNWSKNNPVLLKGEKGLIEGTGKYKIGNGTSKWSDLPLYEGMTTSDRSKLNSIASGATKVTVDSTLSSTSTNPVQNKVINSALAGKSNTNHTHDLSTMINTLSTGTSTPIDDDYYISQYSGGGTTTTTYHRRPIKALFEYIKGKLSTVAVSGSYNDLSNKPTIPTVGNGTVTIKQAGTSKGTFSMNQSGNTTIELTDNNSWRGIQDNLTSTSTTDSLSAAQGKVLNDKFASYVPASRTVNGKALSANISLTASDVGASASGHTHNYAGSASAGGAANSANILNNYFGTKRQASADIDLTNSTYANRVSYMMATSSMTTGKPPSDAHVLTFGWDSTAGWGAQLALGDGSGTHMYVRGADSKNNKSVYGNWKTMLDSDNYNSYAPSKTGAGASGTWGINVTGNAATATKLSSSAGSANQPVYFSDGKPVAGTYTIAKSVPSDAKFTDTVYTHPTTSGNKHIPSGGSAGQILRWSADGTAVWGADNNTTYNDATTSAHGLMTAAMVTKLNGIATNANNYSLPTASSSTLGGVKTTSTVTDTSGYSPCPIVSGVPYYRNPLAQKEYTLSNISGTLAVSKGGTGATSASTGRANLGAVNFVCQKGEPADDDQNVGDLWFVEE